ncbi:RidA family protein [Mycolicibacterium litorale]|uniref:RidA family protein n=1 Tax=Mycolicibacterium litorale TaxID=758802 RepID=UPI003CF236E0
MTVTTINPDALKQPDSFSQVRIGTGSKLIVLAGQVGYAQNTFEMPDGYRAQTRQTVVNIAHTLTEAGAKLSDILRMTVYVVDLDDEKMPEVWAGYTEGLEETGLAAPALAVIGVSSLAGKEYLVEIETLAITD